MEVMDILCIAYDHESETLKREAKMDLNQFKETIAFAIEKEKEAVEFYEKCSGLTSRAGMKDAFVEMAEEEKKHVRMLENYKPAHVEKMKLRDIPDLKIGDYLVDMAFDPQMSYQDLLILAIKREEKAYRLYMNFTREGGEPNVVKLFQLLAQEELKHKNRLEKEYDEMIYQQN